MQKLLVFLAVFFIGCQHVEKKQDFVAQNLLLTFDDFPCQRETDVDKQHEINQKILKILQKHNATAIVFVNSSAIYRDKDANKREQILENWVIHDHNVGNHTYSHKALSQSNQFDYELDIMKCEPILKKTLHKYGKKLKYFRYPFLDYGKNKQQKEKVKKFLRDRGYEIMHITIDTLDWKFNKKMYEGQKDAKSRFMVYVQTQLDANVRKQDNSIILFHVNKLTAECLDEIIRYAKLAGYKLQSGQNNNA